MFSQTTVLAWRSLTLPLTLTVATCCSLQLCAQIVSPAAPDARVSSNLLLGGRPEARHQFLEGDLREHSIQLTGVAFRQRSQIDRNVVARSWGKIMLFVAPCDAFQHSTALDENRTGPQQLAFIGKVSWPAVSRVMTRSQPPWGGQKGELEFPFLKPFSKRRGDDFLLDFHFGRGQLGGGQQGAGAPWYHVDAYPLDAVSELPYAGGDYYLIGGGGCAIQKGLPPQGPESFADIRTWRSDLGDRSRAGTIELSLTTVGLPRDALVLQMLTLSLRNPVPFGNCQTLYVTQPLFTIMQRADRDGRVSLLLGRVPFEERLVRFEIGAQAFYQDPRSQAIRLTHATGSQVAPDPGRYLWNRVQYVADSPLVPKGTFTDHVDQPLLMYSYR